ncbi:hypothetical protein [Rhizorhabdus sp.]|uniref:hypothetical protein n=1 Tax=Rhizorhabdus sp. TaxID=1968843 RepID=UPI0035B1C582
MIADQTRYAIIAATLTPRQRVLLRSLPAGCAFDPDEIAGLAPSIAALRRERLIERLPGKWLRLTDHGVQVRAAAEGMA